MYGIASDGDLMEGVSYEAASLAGHLGLGNLVYLYDDNRITIDGPTSLSFSEDVARRFEAQRWHVQRADGEDHEGLARALAAARAETERPSLVIVRTTIGYGSPGKAGSSKAHGEKLGAEEALRTKQALGWPRGAHLPGARRRARLPRRADRREAGRAQGSPTRASMPGARPTPSAPPPGRRRAVGACRPASSPSWRRAWAARPTPPASSRVR